MIMQLVCVCVCVCCLSCGNPNNNHETIKVSAHGTFSGKREAINLATTSVWLNFVITHLHITSGSNKMLTSSFRIWYDSACINNNDNVTEVPSTTRRTESLGWNINKYHELTTSQCYSLQYGWVKYQTVQEVATVFFQNAFTDILSITSYRVNAF